MGHRIEYEKPSNYTSGVLVGPWVYDRLNAENRIKQQQSLATTYSENYCHKPSSKIDSAIIWNLKQKSEDSNFVSQVGRHDFSNFFENFSSTYELAFNRFPKCFCGRIPRKLRFRLGTHEPTDEYLSSYGNSSYGLVEHKRVGWSCELQDPRKTYTTHYDDTFVCPNVDKYKFTRHATPMTNSSKINDVNVITQSLNLRNRPYLNLPYPFQLIEVSKPPTIDPITWETRFPTKCI